MARSVLALNASYEPMRLVSLETAMRLVWQGKAEIVEADETNPVRSPSTALPRPLVIRLVKFIRVPRRFRRGVTNTFLFARDQYTCQYCGRSDQELGTRKGRKEVLNRDHVVPVSKGGENTWENCVTSCSTCNSLKDNRTPEEAGMTLRSTPGEPQLVWLKWRVRHLTELQRTYIAQFYGEEVLEQLW